MKGSSVLLWMMCLLLLAGLACERAGEILTPEEATAQAQAQEASTFQTRTGEQVETTGPQVGEVVTLTGRGLLINLLNEPGGRISAGRERGATVTIQEIVVHENELWYRIEALTGTGWVKEDNIEPLEEEVEEASSGPQPGDKVYLTAQGFLVNLFREPGGFILAGQEKGAEVTIVEVTEHEGETWYLVDAPTGQGWVPAESITTEAP